MCRSKAEEYDGFAQSRSIGTHHINKPQDIKYFKVYWLRILCLEVTDGRCHTLTEDDNTHYYHQPQKVSQICRRNFGARV